MSPPPSTTTASSSSNTQPTERIYIGGLDPTRGLTVNLVASRLRSVPNVEILSINDVPLPLVDDKLAVHSNPSIYGDKTAIVDADGDYVDNRRFFFIEARRSSSADASSSSSSSALQLLAKQYHNTKWKGCQLRVEEAKPPFLQRLEKERIERAAAVARQQQLVLVESATPPAPHRVEQDEVPPSPNNTHDTHPTQEHTIKEPSIKQRRRLRIRKRFGQEAYHVDAYPQLIEIPSPDTDDSTIIANNNNNHTGWEQFTKLYQRMAQKRQSQWKKLMERRKEERRSWSRGGVVGMPRPHRDNNENEGEDGLNGLMFLNRAIHVRFHDGTEHGQGNGVERHGWSDWREEEEDLEDVDVVSTSSSSSSSSSEANESHAKRAGHDETKGYVWSDEDEEDDDDDDACSESGIHTDDDGSEGNREQRKIGHEYVWSEEESDEEHHLKSKVSEFTIKSNLGMEEFSGGMDFHHDDDDDGSTNNSSVHSNKDSDGNASNHDHSDDGSLRLEDDIRSNLGILSKLFPKEKISVEPLANTESTFEQLHTGNGDGTGGAVKVRTLSNMFGGGLILQRYDPTKEDSAASERKMMNSRMDDGKQATEGQVTEEKNENSPEIQEHFAVPEEKESIALKDSKFEDTSQKDAEKTVNEPDKPEISPQDSTRNDIYEQDKLENIFKQARQQQHGGASASTGFSFGALFESQLDFTPEPLMESSKEVEPELPVKDHSNDAVASHSEINIASQLQANEPQRQARIGLQFPQSVLDEYENLFFSLNEGCRIIADLESVRNDKEVQEQWQKEREVLTADWKRKQKAALSRKVKKVRRY
ncbi:hypothetical protein HJC23_006074 [Cyclotella cryptica]|uniref:Uncharacterized protein n=1 Tax=Cyclotella cryptica TaxID=29204 RepID=A0ABD3QK81_9STRA|eukprot:CCRYP_004530-RA/>CCRYP_004530-RA protein AED:0.00 eAED:0.00 QI:29/-1/1/1/-1/1/1/176/816